MVDREGRAHRFGGHWTDQKLSVLARYLRAYMTALKGKRFQKIYIDGFAGTGYRHARDGGAPKGPSQELLFPELAAPESQDLLDGSARIALQVEPAFDRYVFIERDPKRCGFLEDLKSEFDRLASKIEIYQGDANERIKELCLGDWRFQRAVLFLDPHGMQVEWETLQAVARTRSIDMWLLFPLGMGVQRLLKRSGEIPPSWRRRLDLLLGTTDWYDRFYQVQRQVTLFGDEVEYVVKASTEVIGKCFNDRLTEIFVGVVPEPAVLRNSRNSPLYLLCFAVGNEKGRDIALKIANHLLRDMERLERVP